MNRERFGPNEWYHCYSRGVDKRITFENNTDYLRFMELLYLCNSDATLHRSDRLSNEGAGIFATERGVPFVAIGAYCLMSNHFHLLIKDLSEDGSGISKFMQKVGTAYAMYFNKGRQRTGNLFVRPFRSKHVCDDNYLRKVIQYIHLNPVELFEPRWKDGVVPASSDLAQEILAYPYSSFPDFEDSAARPARSILDAQELEFLRADRPEIYESLNEAAEYYASLE